jgi:hypothetical protein
MHNKPWAAVLSERKLTAANVKKKKKKNPPIKTVWQIQTD